MTQSKELQNEKLINDLYEKLHWYTFEASDEQFDAAFGCIGADERGPAVSV